MSLYTAVRDLRGDSRCRCSRPLTNAQRIIRFERWFGLFHEANIQHWFLHYRELIRLCDDYYGTIHFVAVVGVLLLLFFRYPDRYRVVAKHPGVHDRPGPDRLHVLPGDAAAAAAARLRLRRHPAGRRRPVELLVRAGQRRVQPVRGHAQPAHQLGRPGALWC